MSGTPDRPVEHPFEYEDTYVRERFDSGIERLRVGLRGGHATVLRFLGAALAPPYRLLCVLHTSRIDALLGRYESPDLDGPEIEAFTERFGRFFAEDARADIWLHSTTDDGTVVLDRYNMVYCYGPLERFEEILSSRGVQEVAAWAAPKVPRPHALYYHKVWDDAERKLLESFEWHHKPFRADDVQHWTGPQSS